MAENNEYVSTTMDDGPQVREALDRISAYVPASFVWIEVPEGTVVDLTNPLATTVITGPGDYTIYDYTNGPTGVVNKPLNVNIRKKPGSTTELILFVFDGLNSYLKDGSAAWEEAVIEDSSALTIYRGGNAPTSTDIFWLDTSHYNNGTGYIDLKYHNGTTWVSVFQSAELMYTPEYDSEGHAKDIFKYIDDAIAKVDGHVTQFNQHCANQLALTHVSSDKRTQYNTTLLTAAEVSDMLSAIYKTQFEQVVTEKVESTTKVNAAQTSLTATQTQFEEHVASHITDQDAANWDAKATGDHRHDLDGKVKVSASDVISGVFPVSQIPDEVKERYYQLTSLDEFADSSITDELRKSKYHNGNGFALDTGETDEYGYKKYRWFRIKDQTKIGTPNWEEGVLEFTNTAIPLTWANIVDKPTTLAGYGLDDEAYTKTEVDSMLATPKANYDANQEQYDALAGMIEIPCTGAGFPASGVTITKVGIQQAPDNGAATYNDNRGTYDVIVLLSDGSVYKTTHTTDLRLGFSWVQTWSNFVKADATYFNTRFASYYTEDSMNPLWTSDGLGKCYPTTANPVNLELMVGTTKYIMKFSTTGISFLMSYEDALKCIAFINSTAPTQLDAITDKLQDAYTKWGYPADAPAELIEPTEITEELKANLSVGTETVIIMPQLTPPPIEFVITKSNRNLIGFNDTLEEFTVPATAVIDGRMGTVVLSSTSSAPIFSSTKLKQVNFDPDIESIPQYAFKGCTSLTTVNIPESITTIGDGAFVGCTSLTAMNIPDTVIDVGKSAFSGCKMLVSVHLPNGLATLKHYLFYNCNALSSVNMPEYLTTIGDGAFTGCNSLPSITIPNTVTCIEDGAFYGCRSFTSINIPNTVTTLGNMIFYNCTLLESVTLPNLITAIGSSVFSGCSKLTSITIPNNVTSIGDWAFYQCNSLTSVNLPNGITTIGEYAFYNCYNMTSVNIPNTVVTISDYAFWLCSKITSVTIPASVEYIGEGAFSGCWALPSISVNSGNTHYLSDSYGVLYSCDNTLITYPCGLELTEYSIKSGTLKIGKYAFSQTMVERVIIPNTVTDIGESAFSSCNFLSNVSVPDSVVNIGDYAFGYCQYLESITIPNSVTTIGLEAFNGITTVYYGGTAEGSPWGATTILPYPTT